jgi:hypothetical protein
MSKPVHPKCGKSFPGGDGAGHCANCCETFIGLATFDAHLTRDESGTYHHTNPAEAPAEAKWWLDDRGYWHKGNRLTEEQKAAMFGAKA